MGKQRPGQKSLCCFALKDRCQAHGRAWQPRTVDADLDLLAGRRGGNLRRGLLGNDGVRLDEPPAPRQPADGRLLHRGTQHARAVPEQRARAGQGGCGTCKQARHLSQMPQEPRAMRTARAWARTARGCPAQGALHVHQHRHSANKKNIQTYSLGSSLWEPGVCVQGVA